MALDFVLSWAWPDQQCPWTSMRLLRRKTGDAFCTRQKPVVGSLSTGFLHTRNRRTSSGVAALRALDPPN
uniref:Uncharacterized protein n=1 Tax=Hyaloperonospora arabidopsidis (strain Emoy2) TaxID=559515 RepID=M4B9D9_HYAAE